MAVPTMGLNEGDPRQLGGYRLLGRLRDSSLGVVYLGRDSSGNQVSVAVLDVGAGSDGTARERFVEAVQQSPDVRAARTQGRSALWVAVPHDGSGSVAEGFLEEAARSGRVAARGPVVTPHWAGSRGGAPVRWAPWLHHCDDTVGERAHRRGSTEAGEAERRDGAADEGNEGFLEEAARSGRVAARGPVVTPHWAGSRGGSMADEGVGDWWLIGALGLLLLLFLLLVSLLYWWMLQFPPPEMPGTTQPTQTQEGEDGEESGPDEDGEGEGVPSTPLIPLPGEGQGDWEELPEDNL